MFFDRRFSPLKFVVVGLLLGTLSVPSWAESENGYGSQANHLDEGGQELLPTLTVEGQPEETEASGSVEDIRYNLSTSIYTKHRNPKPEHNNDQKLIGFERQNGDTMWGLALFKNSFYQSTQLVYWAKEFRLDGYVPIPGLRSKWLFGLMHGYKGEYKKKIPFNQLGVAPAIVPTLGIATRYLEADVIFLGFNAITVTATLPIRF